MLVYVVWCEGANRAIASKGRHFIVVGVDITGLVGERRGGPEPVLNQLLLLFW